MEFNVLHSSYVAGKRVEESFGKYRISCKTGSYCSFGIEQISNQRHSHSCYELCIILSGSGIFYYDKENYRISKGDILIADPDVPHEVQSKDPKELKLLYIFIEINTSHYHSSASQEEQIIAAFLAGHKPVSAQPQLMAYLLFIENYNSSKKLLHFGTYQALRNLVLESLSALSLGNTNMEMKEAKNIFETALDYIDANLHRKILIKDVAVNACTSQRNLEYLFQKYFGKTVIEYIHEKKINLACHYLEMYFSVKETAQLVDIHNAAQFSKLFKKCKGLSPTEYQRSKVEDRKGMGRRL